jgi:ectoine hydroxylase
MQEYQLDDYNQKGYHIIPNLFDPTELQLAAKNCELIKSENFTYETDGTIRSLFAPHWYSNTVKDFVYNNPAIPYVKSILGEEIYVHQVHFNYKKAHTGGEYAWHSDYTFWDAHDGMPTTNAISVLFFLDPMTAENGPLEILEGSHNHLVIKENKSAWTINHDASETDGMISEDMVSKTQYKRHTVLGNPGDTLLMHANAWHTSAANTSNLDRTILFVCYNRIDNQTTLETRPDYIVLRDFSLVP